MFSSHITTNNRKIPENQRPILSLSLVPEMSLQTKNKKLGGKIRKGKNESGQFCIETLHESRKRKSSGLFVRISTFTYCIYPCDKSLKRHA